jgi:hypothetical protein
MASGSGSQSGVLETGAREPSGVNTAPLKKKRKSDQSSNPYY